MATGPLSIAPANVAEDIAERLRKVTVEAATLAPGSLRAGSLVFARRR
jgi:hypothetical protein